MDLNQAFDKSTSVLTAAADRVLTSPNVEEATQALYDACHAVVQLLEPYVDPFPADEDEPEAVEVPTGLNPEDTA